MTTVSVILHTVRPSVAAKRAQRRTAAADRRPADKHERKDGPEAPADDTPDAQPEWTPSTGRRPRERRVYNIVDVW